MIACQNKHAHSQEIEARQVEKVCTNCGRTVCIWHSALSPVSVDGQVRMVPVCYPPCDSPFWKGVPRE